MDEDGLSRPNHSRKLSRQLDSLTYWNIVMSPSGLFALSSRVEIPTPVSSRSFSVDSLTVRFPKLKDTLRRFYPSGTTIALWTSAGEGRG